MSDIGEVKEICNGNRENQTEQENGKPEVTEENYVDEAEKYIKNLAKKPEEAVTTTKIRNLLSITTDIYNDVINCDTEELPDSICGRISYLRARFMYEAGREKTVKKLLNETYILELLEKDGKRKKKQTYILFRRYLEALVAFHRYYINSDEEGKKGYV